MQVSNKLMTLQLSVPYRVPPEVGFIDEFAPQSDHEGDTENVEDKLIFAAGRVITE